MIQKISIIFVLIILSTFSLYSQSKTDTNDIFKMHLFLDKKNISRSDLNKKITKNDSLYDSFSRNSLLRINTLKLKSNIFFPSDGNFTFYVIDNIEYKRGLSSDESWFLKIDLNADSKYIIAINESTGRSYRLAGFNGNDFLVFFSDISKAYKSYNFKELKISRFLKEYTVESIDFECLYKGLKNGIIDKEKFPCLKTCSDTFSLHQLR